MYRIEFKNGEFVDYYTKNPNHITSHDSFSPKSGNGFFYITGLEEKMRIKTCSDSDYWYANKIGKEVTIIHFSTFCAISKTEIGNGKFHYGYIYYYDLEHVKPE